MGAPKRFLGLFSESGVDGTLGDGALVVGFLVGVVNRGSGWKNSFSFVMALFTGVPCSRKGVAGRGFFFSSWIRFSTATVRLSSLDVAGMGNFVSGNMTVSTGMVDLVTGMKMLHCLQ